MDRMWAPWRLEYIESVDDEKDGCIFCDLPKDNNDKKNLIVYQDELCFVIMNKYPYNNGHIMVVPYEHKSDLLDLSDEILLNTQQVIKKAIQVLKDLMHPHGFNVGLNVGRPAGAGIDEHIHYHIVPRWNGDTNCMPVLANTKVVSEAIDQTCEKLSNKFKEI
jgi:ATP adenylyltransferase